jgi:serine acetyltransferase
LLQHLFFNCAIPASCTIGKGTKFGNYAITVVLNDISDYCVVVGKLAKSNKYRLNSEDGEIKQENYSRKNGRIRENRFINGNYYDIISMDILENEFT